MSTLFINFKIMKFKLNVFKLYFFKNSWCHRCLIYRKQLCVVLFHLISSIEQRQSYVFINKSAFFFFTDAD